MLFRLKKSGFTLVELLVVISIIGILSAALITQVSKMRDTARTLKCKANLRNLGQAALNYAVDNMQLPWAGSHEDVYTVRGGSRQGGFKRYVSLRKGWVDWTLDASVENWPKEYNDNASFSGAGRMVTKMYGRAGYLSVTNGTLWGYMGRDLSLYVCESHKSQAKSKLGITETIYRSYFMNDYFGYNKDNYPLLLGSTHRDVLLNSLSDRGSAASLLLFAEMPVTGEGDANRVRDGVIEAVISGYNDGADTKTTPLREWIGFNHTVGKRKVAHVVYADGHVDVIHSGSGLTVDQMKGLTYFLCNGYELPKDTAEWKTP